MKIDVALTIGQVTQKTEVTGEPSVIVTENAQVGKVIDNKSITQLPLNGRLNIMGLMSLAPGIQNAGSQDQVPYFGITPTVSGAPPQDPWHFPWTGLQCMSWIERGLVEYPPLDGLQEFKVITSGASAEFGKANQVIVYPKAARTISMARFTSKTATELWPRRISLRPASLCLPITATSTEGISAVLSFCRTLTDAITLSFP